MSPRLRHEIGASRLLHGVSIKQRYPGHSKQAGHTAQCAANYANRFIIVVDEDIDVTNPEQLIGPCALVAIRRRPSI